MNLEVRGVRKAFPHFELGPLSLQLRPGIAYGLLGPNGSGKTTLLNLITLQLRPTAGELLADGAPIRWGDRAWKARCAYIREAPTFYDEMTVAQTLAFAGRLHDRWDRDLAERMAARLRLDTTRRVGKLSKGTKVKVGVVAALAQQASLLLLDEPTAGLDPTAREELYALLHSIRRERPDVTMLLSSHLFEDIAELADEVRILRHGALAFSTSRQELETMALLRLPDGPLSVDRAEARLVWRQGGETWIIAPRSSELVWRLRGRDHVVIERPVDLLAAAYRGVERQEADQ